MYTAELHDCIQLHIFSSLICLDITSQGTRISPLHYMYIQYIICEKAFSPSLSLALHLVLFSYAGQITTTSYHIQVSTQSNPSRVEK